MNVELHCDDEPTIIVALKIAKRAKKLNPDLETIDVFLDLMAVHEYDGEMDFERLLKADDSNLMHDVYGISAHLNRETGKLEDCFVPRFQR